LGTRRRVCTTWSIGGCGKSTLLKQLFFWLLKPSNGEVLLTKTRQRMKLKNAYCTGFQDSRGCTTPWTVFDKTWHFRTANIGVPEQQDKSKVYEVRGKFSNSLTNLSVKQRIVRDQNQQSVHGTGLFADNVSAILFDELSTVMIHS